MILKRLLLLLSVFGFVHMAQAHDPGMSRANIQAQQTGMTIQMLFARKDIAFLVAMDKNYDGSISEDEFQAVHPEIQSLLVTAVDVRSATGRLQPTSIRIVPVQGDAVNVDYDYEFTSTSEIKIHIPLLTKLARGHRQHLTVRDVNGTLLAQHILDARSPAITLKGSTQAGLAVLRQYFVEGVWHIWIGFDHILFLLTLLLPAVLIYKQSRWYSRDTLRPAMTDILKTVTAFTIAHSITLALAVMDIVNMPGRLVESAIALSVLVAAVNNLRPFFPASRWVLAFVFGLVHGFGFASVLAELGLPGNALMVSLLGFNLGVEAGQLAIVALIFPVSALIRHTVLYRSWVVSGGSVAAILIAMVWMVERIFDYEVPGIG